MERHIVFSENSPRQSSSQSGRRLTTRYIIPEDVEKPESLKPSKQSRGLRSPQYIYEQEGSLISSIDNYKYDRNEPQLFSRNPSYSKFQVSYNVVCAARYRKARNDYNAQFDREIKMLTEYSPTAIDATGFVKWTSYTTLWPPYHNLAELKQTSKTFYKLSTKEQQRLKKIMSTDFT